MSNLAAFDSENFEEIFAKYTRELENEQKLSKQMDKNYAKITENEFCALDLQLQEMILQLENTQNEQSNSENGKRFVFAESFLAKFA